MYIDVVRTFSPKKFRISTVAPSSPIMQLMGKCAYTRRILYKNPYEIPTRVSPAKRILR